MTSDERRVEKRTKLATVLVAVAAVAILAMTANGIIYIGAAMHDAFHIH